jgi:hypothetical protein
VGCSIFESELTATLAGQEQYDIDFFWLKAGYHARVDLLNTRLKEALSQFSAADIPLVRVFFGQNCLVDIADVTRGFKLLPEANCLTSMLGAKRLRDLECGPSMVVTTSWVRKIYFSKDPEFQIWDNTDFRINFGRYEKIIILDTGLEPLADEEVLELYDLTETVVEFEKSDLDYFKNLVWDFLA